MVTSTFPSCNVLLSFSRFSGGDGINNSAEGEAKKEAFSQTKFDSCQGHVAHQSDNTKITVSDWHHVSATH